MDETWGHYANEVCQTEKREILYDLACMWNLNNWAQTNRKQTVGYQGQGEECVKWVKVVRVQTSNYKIVSSQDVLPSMVTMVNNTIRKLLRVNFRSSDKQKTNCIYVKK